MILQNYKILIICNYEIKGENYKNSSKLFSILSKPKFFFGSKTLSFLIEVDMPKWNLLSVINEDSVLNELVKIIISSKLVRITYIKLWEI